MRSRLPQICVLLALLAAVVLCLLTPPPPAPPAVGASSAAQASEGLDEIAVTAHAASSGAVLETFDAWLAAWTAGSGLAGEGVALARQREARMLTLIKEDPAEALAQAVSFAEYSALPEAVRAHVERPFSAQAELLVLPVCASGGGQIPEIRPVLRQLIVDGESFEASVFGRRTEVGSKQASPLQGITLGGVAALREEIFQLVDSADAAGFPEASAAENACFSTGRELGEGAVVAVAGGRRFHFASAEIAAEFDERVARFDLEPGPHTGAQVVFLMADGAAVAGEGFDWEAAAAEVELQASSWTETPKDVYFIRVDFSDKPGASISQAELAGIVNTTVSDTIAAMSYGKSSINATVSPIVVRMPNPTTSYAPSNNDGLHDAAKAAALAQIPGLDLSAYDIVGVHFASIGMGSGGLGSYAGLAGGSRQWLQGTSSSNVIIHEFGHNYGLGHASFWSTTDGSVVGAGASDEYGDEFDIMGDGSNEAHFHPQAKQYLDWLEPAQWTDATAAGAGTYRIYRFDDPATTGITRGVRITKAASPSEYYWIGYRKRLANNPWLQSGIYLIWERPGFDRSWLLDTTPGSTEGRDDGAVVLGRTYSDTAAGVHITALGTGGAGADEWIDVSINFGSGSGNTAPTATLSGPATADAREPLNFSVNASDVNGDELAYFWDFGDGSISDNQATQTRSWSVGGSYTIRVTVSDMKGGTVTKTQAVTVSDPLDNWTQRTSGTDADLNDIATDGSKLVAVGYVPFTGIYRTSTDGTSWTGGDIGSNVFPYAVIHDGTQFLAAGEEYQFVAPAGWYGVIFTSPNGGGWARQHFSGAPLRDIASSGSVHVAVGDSGTIWRSTDGSSWNPIPSGTSTNLNGVSYGDGIFVAVGSAGNGGSGVVLRSTDGSSWSETSSGAELLSWQGFYDIEYCNDRFLASGWYSKIRHSTDGGTTFSTTRSITEEIPGFAYGNGVYFAAGEDTTDFSVSYIRNLISIDGENWTPLTTNAGQNERNGAIFFKDTFITVADGGQIWQSAAFAAPPVASGFATWLEGYFPGATPQTAALLDDDGDGLSALQEYASGSDPTLAKSAFPPASSELGGYLTLTVTKDPSITDITYLVEISSNLEDWDSAGTVIVSEDASSLVVRSASLVTASGNERQFMRVRYTLVE